MSPSPQRTVKSDLARAFVKKLPRKKFITERDISERFGLRRQSVFFLMRDIAIEYKLKTELSWQLRDNGRKYLVRIYYKP